MLALMSYTLNQPQSEVLPSHCLWYCGYLLMNKTQFVSCLHPTFKNLSFQLYPEEIITKGWIWKPNQG